MHQKTGDEIITLQTPLSSGKNTNKRLEDIQSRCRKQT